MSISPGFTAAEIREFVHEYQRVNTKSPSNSQDPPADEPEIETQRAA